MMLAQTSVPKYSIDNERMLINRAIIFQNAKEYEKALEDYNIALGQFEKRDITKLQDYDLALLLRGSLLLEMGATNKVSDVDILTSINELQEKINKRYARTHSFNGFVAMLKGNYYFQRKDYQNAHISLAEANAILGIAIGVKSYDYLRSLGLLAICEWRLGDLHGAEEKLRRGNETYLEIKDAVFSTMTEAQRRDFWQLIKPQIDLFMLFAIENGSENPHLIKEAYNLHIETKGLLFTVSSELRRKIYENGDPILIAKFNEWVALREELLTMYNTDQMERERESRNAADLQDRIVELERTLIGVLGDSWKAETVRFEDVQKSLEATEAAIEIVRIEKDDMMGTPLHYLALIVQPGKDAPTLVSLQNSGQLEKRRLSYYRNVINYQLVDVSSYQQYWEEIDRHLIGVTKVYLSNDGVFHQINVQGLKTTAGNFVIDKMNVAYVSNSAKIIQMKNEEPLAPTGKVSYLFGNPQFDRAGTITALPGSGEEINNLRSILLEKDMDVRSYQSDLATEENLKSITHSSVLHIATHGYFLEESPKKGLMEKDILFKALDNPLLRSGLLMAGATGSVPNFTMQSDGVFSAYEALHLDLNGTKLVVLSACETGKGEVVAGEGVYGLGRSFQVAGASAVIMSLWKIDDRATSEMMTEFYSLWTRGTEINQAFDLAQKSLREKYPHPYYWSPFVLLN
jgi:CHAT domain-containing protein